MVVCTGLSIIMISFTKETYCRMSDV
jgi:hypothetical protein